MSAILKFDFQKRKQLCFSEVNYLNYTKKQPNFACGNYIFPKTRGNKNKPWTHSTPLKQSSETDLVFHFTLLHLTLLRRCTSLAYSLTNCRSCTKNLGLISVSCSCMLCRAWGNRKQWKWLETILNKTKSNVWVDVDHSPSFSKYNSFCTEQGFATGSPLANQPVYFGPLITPGIHRNIIRKAQKVFFLFCFVLFLFFVCLFVCFWGGSGLKDIFVKLPLTLNEIIVESLCTEEHFNKCSYASHTGTKICATHKELTV